MRHSLSIILALVALALISCIREKDADNEIESVPVARKSMSVRGAVDEQESNKLFYTLYASPLAILLNSTRVVDGRPELVLGLEAARSLGVNEDLYKEYVMYLETIER